VNGGPATVEVATAAENRVGGGGGRIRPRRSMHRDDVEAVVDVAEVGQPVGVVRAPYEGVWLVLGSELLEDAGRVSGRLPSIADLQDHYKVPGLNTVRQAQQLLVADGLVETRQGVGAFMISHEPTGREVDVVAELRAARAAIDRALTALTRADTPGAGR